MYYVYLITSIKHPNQFYIGYTNDVQKRLITHNHGGSPHTAKYKPWKLAVYLYFASKERAVKFEKYLKSQSGRAFLNKRFLSP